MYKIFICLLSLRSRLILIDNTVCIQISIWSETASKITNTVYNSMVTIIEHVYLNRNPQVKPAVYTKRFLIMTF